MQTGDILLFHREDYWFSSVVEWATWSKISHTAMVLKNPTYLDSSLEGLYMIEAGRENFPGAICHRIMTGVQVVDLNKVIENYTGNIYVRKLEISDEERSNVEHILSEIWPKVEYHPYDKNIWDLFRSLFDINMGNNFRNNSYVCSTLIAFLYEQFSFLKIEIPWDLVLPRDFDDNGKIDKILIPKLSPKTNLL